MSGAGLHMLVTSMKGVVRLKLVFPRKRGDCTLVKEDTGEFSTANLSAGFS